MLGMALVMALVVGSTLYFVRPMANVGPGLAAVAPAPQMQAGYPADSAKTVEVQVVADEWRMDPNRLELTAGVPFKLTFRNQGTIEHDITVAAAHIKLAAAPGKTTEGTFTIDTPGTYDFLCSIPGHAEAGMK